MLNEQSELREVRQYVLDNRSKGVVCPCCDQLAKEYSRPMHATMARVLLNLYKKDKGEPNGYFRLNGLIEGVASGWGDFAKLRYWGLIVQETNSDPKKRTSGNWAITAKGRMFVEGKGTVSSHIRLYNSEFLGLEGTPVSIRTVLGNKYDYEQVMDGFIPPSNGQSSLL